MLTRNDDNDEMSDYDKIRMRNIQERLDLYKKVRCYERPASLALKSALRHCYGILAPVGY